MGRVLDPPLFYPGCLGSAQSAPQLPFLRCHQT